MSLASLMIHTVDIQTLVEGKSATGGVSRSWSTIASAVPSRVQKSTDDSIIAYGRLGVKVTNRVYFNDDYGLNIKDRIVFNGDAYEVRAIENAGGNLNRLWQVDCEALALGATGGE